MAKRLLLRDAENLSADMLQRILGGLTSGLGAVSGVGTGYSVGGVGKMNASWLGATLPTGHLVVTANGTSTLTILPGWATVLRDAGTSSYDPRALFAESDANDTVTITSNATGSTRNDTVCLKIDQATAPTSDGSNLVSFEIIAGAAGGGLSNAPADGNLHLPLANVAVANGVAIAAQAAVTDKRVWLPSDINPYKARGINNANQAAIGAATFAKVALQSADHDSNGNFDTTNFRYYAAVPGYYQVSGVVAFAGTLTANNRVIAMIYKNGVEVPGTRASDWSSETTAATVIEVPTPSQVLKLNAGDYIELFAWSTNTMALQGSGGDFCSLSAHLLSGL